MIKGVREEGHYTLKRVKKLPKRGNSNLLYAFIGPVIDKLYRWLPNGEYEIITLGGSAVFQATALTFNSTTNILSSTYADGSSHNVSLSNIFSQTDTSFDGATGDVTITFSDGSTGTMNLYQNATSLSYDATTGDLTATFLDGNSDTINLLNIVTGTYSELETLADNGELVIGQQYILTDYQTEYYILGSNSGKIVKERSNTQTVSGYGFFDPPITELVLGSTIEVTYLPPSYTGAIQVGDTATVSQYFSEYYMKFSNNLHSVLGSKFEYSVPRFSIGSPYNEVVLNDGNGKVVLKPDGVINTEVHDGTSYMDMTATENIDVPTEQLSLVAISETEFSLQAESLTFQGDTLEYDFRNNEIKNEDEKIIGLRKGFIIRRINYQLQINIDKDWRVQRYRRFKVNEAEQWNNYILSNKEDHTLYEMGGDNSCSLASTNIKEEHKYILPFIENKNFYQDFTKLGTIPNVFLSGQATAPNLVYGDRFGNIGQEEFKQDLNSSAPDKAKDFTIIQLQTNLDPISTVEKVFVEKLWNTVFVNYTSQYGLSGKLRLEIKDGISQSTFLTHPQITSNSFTNTYGIYNTTAVDIAYLTNAGTITSLHCLATCQINNAGIVVFLTVGGFANNVRPHGTTYINMAFDSTCNIRNCIFGGKRVDNLKFVNTILNKFLYTFDRSQYNSFTDSTCYLTAIKGFVDNYTHRYTIDVGTGKNLKKNLYGYFYDKFASGHGRYIFNNNLGDMLFKDIDGNNMNQTTVLLFSESQ